MPERIGFISGALCGNLRNSLHESFYEERNSKERKKKIQRYAKDTAYRGIVSDIPYDDIAIVPAAEAHEEVAVAREAQILNADLVRLVAALYRALLVIPNDHRRLRPSMIIGFPSVNLL